MKSKIELAYRLHLHATLIAKSTLYDPLTFVKVEKTKQKNFNFI